MEYSTSNTSFGTANTSTGSALSTGNVVSRFSSSVPVSSGIPVDRATTDEISMQQLRKPSSLEFAEQIRQLEVEGSKLRSATVSALAQGDLFDFPSLF